MESSSAERRPDFSGEWVLNRPACTLSPGADGVQGAAWRIEHHEPRFHQKASFVSSPDSKPFEYEFELLTDGREVVSSLEGGRIVSSLRWEGDALVVTWLTEQPDDEMTVSFRYELIDAGRRLRAVEQLRARTRHQDNVWMFDRR